MLRSLRLAVVLLLWVGVASDGGAQSAAPGAATSARLQPGDAVRITVWRQPELTGEFAVTADGQIAHPLYREVRVSGLSMTEVEAQLAAFLRRFVENPRFVVEPLLRVTVSGEVRRPDVLAVAPGTTVAQVVAKAGGVTERGRPDRARLVRGQTERIVSLVDPRESQMPVQSGDEVRADARSQWFRNVLLPAATIIGAAASLVIAIRRDD